MWTEILSVGAGSCVGGMARYAVSRWVQQAAAAGFAAVYAAYALTRL